MTSKRRNKRRIRKDTGSALDEDDDSKRVSAVEADDTADAADPAAPSRVPEPGGMAETGSDEERSARIIQRAARGYLARKVMKQRKEMQRKRSHIVREILSTERDYVASLTKMIDMYMKPLRELDPPIVTNDDLKKLFGSIEVILNFARQFLMELEKVMSEWNASTALGPTLLSLASWGRYYAQYALEYEGARRQHRHLEQTQVRYREFCRQQRVNDMQAATNVEQGAGGGSILSGTRMAGLELPGYLITPIQRLPRYIMLVRDLVKNTWPEHRDLEKLKEALRAIEDVTQYVNERKREGESMARIVELSEMLLGCPRELITADRRCLAECTLEMLYASPDDGQVTSLQRPLTIDSNTIWRPMRFVLFNDMLLIAKLHGKTGVLGTLGGKRDEKQMRFYRSFPLKDLTVAEPDPRDASIIATAASSSSSFSSSLTAYRQDVLDVDHDVRLRCREYSGAKSSNLPLSTNSTEISDEDGGGTAMKTFLKMVADGGAVAKKEFLKRDEEATKRAQDKATLTRALLAEKYVSMRVRGNLGSAPSSPTVGDSGADGGGGGAQGASSDGTLTRSGLRSWKQRSATLTAGTFAAGDSGGTDTDTSAADTSPDGNGGEANANKGMRAWKQRAAMTSVRHWDKQKLASEADARRNELLEEERRREEERREAHEEMLAALAARYNRDDVKRTLGRTFSGQIVARGSAVLDDKDAKAQIRREERGAKRKSLSERSAEWLRKRMSSDSVRKENRKSTEEDAELRSFIASMEARGISVQANADGVLSGAYSDSERGSGASPTGAAGKAKRGSALRQSTGVDEIVGVPNANASTDSAAAAAAPAPRLRQWKQRANTLGAVPVSAAAGTSSANATTSASTTAEANSNAPAAASPAPLRAWKSRQISANDSPLGAVGLPLPEPTSPGRGEAPTSPGASAASTAAPATESEASADEKALAKSDHDHVERSDKTFNNGKGERRAKSHHAIGGRDSKERVGEQTKGRSRRLTSSSSRRSMGPSPVPRVTKSELFTSPTSGIYASRTSATRSDTGGSPDGARQRTMSNASASRPRRAGGGSGSAVYNLQLNQSNSAASSGTFDIDDRESEESPPVSTPTSARGMKRRSSVRRKSKSVRVRRNTATGGASVMRS